MAKSESLFTQADVEVWDALLLQLVEERSVLNKKIEALIPLLRGAKVFLNLDSTNKTIDLPHFDEPEPKKPEEASLVDALYAVLKQSSNPLDNKQIKEKLPAAGFSVKRQKSSPNYYYTAINRLIARKMIVKYEGGKYWISNNETEGDMFAQTTPSASIRDRSNHPVSPTAQDREAVSGGGT